MQSGRKNLVGAGHEKKQLDGWDLDIKMQLVIRYTLVLVLSRTMLHRQIRLGAEAWFFVSKVVRNV